MTVLVESRNQPGLLQLDVYDVERPEEVGREEASRIHCTLAKEHRLCVTEADWQLIATHFNCGHEAF